ncbi:MAG: hypothetical protein ACKOWL_07040 [Sphingobacteriaceae bacterium]
MRYFEWIDPATTLRVKLEPDTHELWKEVEEGLWIKSNSVSFDDKIVQDLPEDYSVHSAFYTGDSVVTFTLHGMSNVYAYNINTQTLERLDRSFYKGYNFSSTEFIRQDTLYSFGGYGFWHFNNTQTFFDKKYKEWFLYKSKNKGPETIKGGLQGYDTAKDVFYSGLGLDDPALIGGKKENSPSFYQFNFKTKEWAYLGEINKKLQLANVDLGIYWNGRYFIGWSTKELYVIDPRENKIYSNKTMDLPFVVEGKFYTKADTLMYYSSNGRTILKYAIKQIIQQSDELGPLYKKGMSVNNYMGLGFLLLGGLGAYIKIRRSKRRKSSFFTEQEENLLSAFIRLGSLTTQDINDVLGSASKSLDNQRRIRSITIKQINEKLFKAYGIKEGIEKQANVEDKRLTIYNLQESLAESLEKDGRFV